MRDPRSSPAPETPTLLWFLKAPERGRVKTRLASEIGEAPALAAYQTMVEVLWTRLAPQFPSMVYYDPPGEATQREMERWLPGADGWRPQAAGDLGARLTQAFDQHFAECSGPAMAIGGDCPGLTTGTIEEASLALQEVEVVLGPAADGGYVLIGLRRPTEAVFQDIAWSTERVLEQTLARARAAGLSWRLLGVLEDVDDAASWSRARVCLDG